MATAVAQTSPSSAAPASTRSSTTPRSTTSRRRTARRPRRSRSATVAGRRVAFLPRHGPHHELPAARDQLPRQPLGAALARRPPGAGAVRGRRPARRGRARRPRRARPARRPDLPPDPVVRRDAARCTCRSPTPTARASPRPSLAADPDVQSGRHDGRDRGAAVLHPRRVAALRRAGLDADQHDRRPRGGPRPRAADVLLRDRAGHRHGRRRRVRRGGRPGGGLRAVPGRTSSGSPACSTAPIGDAARPRRLHLLDLGRRHRPDLRHPAAR